MGGRALALWFSTERTRPGKVRVSLVVQAGYDDTSFIFDSIPEAIRESLDIATANVLDNFSVSQRMLSNLLDRI